MEQTLGARENFRPCAHARSILLRFHFTRLAYRSTNDEPRQERKLVAQGVSAGTWRHARQTRQVARTTWCPGGAAARPHGASPSHASKATTSALVAARPGQQVVRATRGSH